MQVREEGTWNWGAVAINSNASTSNWACNAYYKEEKQKLVDMEGLGNALWQRWAMF